jgi:hypothetical protein
MLAKYPGLKDRVVPTTSPAPLCSLAADDSRVMTGQTMVVDAGRT